MLMIELASRNGLTVHDVRDKRWNWSSASLRFTDDNRWDQHHFALQIWRSSENHSVDAGRGWRTNSKSSIERSASETIRVSLDLEPASDAATVIS